MNTELLRDTQTNQVPPNHTTAQALMQQCYNGAGIPSETLVEGYRTGGGDRICDCDDDGECCGY